MATRKENTFPIRGLDLTTPGHQLPSGACRLLWDLVPTGRGEGAVWEVPKVATDTGVENLLSIGRHTEDRLIGVRADEVVVIDPNSGYAETQVWSFSSRDSTRRATFAEVQDSTLVSIVSGSAPRTPDVTLEVIGTDATRAEWPALPLVSVTDEALDTGIDDESAFFRGFYGFRVAWELADGTMGPATPMLWAFSEKFQWQARFEVQRYDTPLPAIWDDRIEHLVLICHPPTYKTEDGAPSRITTRPEHNPGYIVQRQKQYDVGATFSFSASGEDIRANPTYDGIGLAAHEIRAGTAGSYNQRALLGDVEYDLARPDIKKQLQWDSSEHSGGDDYHVLLRVTIQTQDGDVERLSEPVPYDASSIQSVSLRWGHLTYPDSRAKSYEFFVSSNYNGDIGAADWEIPSMIGASREFEGLGGSGLAYDGIGADTWDFTNRDGATFELFFQRLFKQSVKAGRFFNGFVGADYRLHGDAIDPDAGNVATQELTESEIVRFGDIFPPGGADVEEFSFDIEMEAFVESEATSASFAEAEVEVEIREKDGTVLDSYSKTINQGGPGTTSATPTGITFDRSTVGSWSKGDAYDLKFRLRVDLKAQDSSPGNGVAAQSDAYVRIYNGDLSVEKATNNTTYSPSRSATQDVNTSRIIWSETNRPIDYPAENLVYAGERDRVMALAPTGQEVSASQYGEYPLVVFGDSSVRLLRIGQEPFVQGVDVLTVNQGIVGRRAATTVDGRVVAALDGGVYAFSSQLEQPSLSRPLNDVGEEFLQSLGPDVAVGHYKNVERGRNDVWVAAGGRVWNYSIDQGAWSALRRQRQDFALRPGEEYAARPDGALVREVAAEGEGQINIQTAVLQTGPLGMLKRMRQVQVRQPTPLEEVELSLVATDPQREYIKLESATLQAGQLNGGVVPDAGLGTGFVLDIRGRALTGQSIESIFVEWDVRNRTIRDHQAHEYPAYLDAPTTTLAQADSDTTLLAKLAESEETTTLVLISTNDL